MKAVILAPGPSLARCPRPSAEVVIGVNRAAAFIGCSIWAALDSPLIQHHGREVVGSPTLFTRRASFDSLARHGDPWGSAYRPVCYAEDLACSVPRWDLYTLTASLVLAQSLGAASVEVYGCDWTDAPDWDNARTVDQNRGEARWELERSIYAEVTAWLESRGCEVAKR